MLLLAIRLHWLEHQWDWCEAQHLWRIFVKSHKETCSKILLYQMCKINKIISHIIRTFSLDFSKQQCYVTNVASISFAAHPSQQNQLRPLNEYTWSRLLTANINFNRGSIILVGKNRCTLRHFIYKNNFTILWQLLWRPGPSFTYRITQHNIEIIVTLLNNSMYKRLGPVNPFNETQIQLSTHVIIPVNPCK